MRACGVGAIFIGGRGAGGDTVGADREGGEVRPKGVAGAFSLENLHAMVSGVGHHDAPVAVDGNAARGIVELSVA